MYLGMGLAWGVARRVPLPAPSRRAPGPHRPARRTHAANYVEKTPILSTD